MQRALAKIRAKNPDLAAKIENMGGFITSDQTAALVEVDRLMLVLVRCGNGRFLCPVQNLDHFLTIIREHSDLKSKQTGQQYEGDYVRDVSLPSEGG